LSSTATINLDSSPPAGAVVFTCPSSSNGKCGYSSTVLDINGDGYGDVVICSYSGELTGSDTNQEGWCYVGLGKKSGWTSP